MAVPDQFATDKKEFNEYVQKIQNIPIQRFINVKDKRKIYDNTIEDRLFDSIIKLVDRRLNKSESDSEKFRRIPHTGGKLIIYGSRPLLNN